MYIFCSLSWSSFSLTRGSYFNKKLRKEKFQCWWLHQKIGCWQLLRDFVNFDNICHVILKKKIFFRSNCRENVNRRGVNIRREDIKVTFVSFRLHVRRITVECTEYGNTLFSHFDIFIYVSLNFTLDSRIADNLQCHIGLDLQTCFIHFDLVKSRENCDKEFYMYMIHDTCFEPNPRCAKLFAFK